jgi:hypothetical protein
MPITFADHGITQKRAKELRACGIRPEDLHLVFCFEGEDLPLRVALDRGGTAALRAFREACGAAEKAGAAEGRAAYARAHGDVARLRELVAVDVEAGARLAAQHDRDAAPVQRLQVHSLRAIVDFDSEEICFVSGYAGGRTVDLSDVLWEGSSSALCDALVGKGIADYDAEDLADEIHWRWERWGAAASALSEAGLKEGEVRAILSARARACVEEDRRQTALDFGPVGV